MTLLQTPANARIEAAHRTRQNRSSHCNCWRFYPSAKRACAYSRADRTAYEDPDGGAASLALKERKAEAQDAAQETVQSLIDRAEDDDADEVADE